MNTELERMKREISDKGTISELIELKQKVYAQLEGKVELKEVQSALNEC